MIDIKSLASSSQGNAYLLDDGRSLLLLEAGINIDRIRKGSGYRLPDIAGCLISHEHHDHGGYAKQIMDKGIDIYTSKGTANALNLAGHRLNIMEAFGIYKIGGWQVTGFYTNHNAAEPFGFLIRSLVTGEKVLFFIDTYEMDFKFEGLDYIMAGVDYDEPSLQESCDNNEVDVFQLDHVHDNHMSLGKFKFWLLQNNLSTVQQIWVLHLSKTNADRARFKKEIQRFSGKEVIIAN